MTISLKMQQYDMTIVVDARTHPEEEMYVNNTEFFSALEQFLRVLENYPTVDVRIERSPIDEYGYGETVTVPDSVDLGEVHLSKSLHTSTDLGEITIGDPVEYEVNMAGDVNLNFKY